jgi:hypothetical protein
MARTLLLADEISVPGATGTATSFTQATVVRLVNNNTTAAVVTVVESQGGAGIGSFTMPGNSVEYLEKVASHCVFAVGGSVLGTKVGFTG